MKKHARLFTILLIVAWLLSGCDPSEPEIAPLTTPVSAATPTSPADPTVIPPQIDHRIRVELTHTSVWADLRVQNEQDVISADLVSVSGDPTYQDATPGGQAIDQPISEAESGHEVGITVDYQVKWEGGGDGLAFRLQRDDLNGCTVRIYDLMGADPQLVYALDHQEKTGTDDKNTIDFSLDLNTMEVTLNNAPDIIFYNGVILTIDPSNEKEEAIAIQGERIFSVGKDAHIFAYQGENTISFDLQGKTLMPGFVDGHSHNFSSTWRGDLEGGQAYLLSLGITTAAEMLGDESLMGELHALDEGGKLRMRLSLYPSHVDVCGGVMGDWYWPNYPPSREPGAMLHFPGIKIFNDGGGCNRAAVSFEFKDGGQGDLYFQVDELAEMIIEAQERGYQVAIHGTGDRAIEVNLDAIEAALGGGPNTYRHRIEHNTLVRDDMLTRYTEVDVVAMLFGFFPTCFFNGPGYATPDPYQEWEWRWRSLIDANPEVHFAWHADAPPLGDPSPMRNLHGFVTRRDLGDYGASGPLLTGDGTVCEPPDWASDDLLRVEEALPMMTIESAYSILRDDELGSLEAGKLADLIILSENPLQVDDDTLPGIQVLMTMVGGNTEHCAPGYEGLCP
jgi:predicted amidohydrolase YtcJ